MFRSALLLGAIAHAAHAFAISSRGVSGSAESGPRRLTIQGSRMIDPEGRDIRLTGFNWNAIAVSPYDNDGVCLRTPASNHTRCGYERPTCPVALSCTQARSCRRRCRAPTSRASSASSGVTTASSTPKAPRLARTPTASRSPATQGAGLCVRPLYGERACVRVVAVQE